MDVAEVLTFIPLHILPFNVTKLYDNKLNVFKYQKIGSFNAQYYNLVLPDIKSFSRQ